MKFMVTFAAVLIFLVLSYLFLRAADHAAEHNDSEGCFGLTLLGLALGMIAMYLLISVFVVS